MGYNYFMSFKENFERGGEKENLDYDDSAFYYFALAMLNVVLIPATYYLVIKPVLFGEFAINSRLKNPECDLFKERMAERAKLYRFSWLNKWFVINCIFLTFFWYLTYIRFDVIRDIEPLKTFVPHELL